MSEDQKHDRAPEILAQTAAAFFSRQSNRQSLITVTHCRLSPDKKNATFYITVLPEEKEEEAIAFAKRQRSELRQYLKEQLKLRVLPFVEVVIDVGEKNRQHIEDLLAKGHNND